MEQLPALAGALSAGRLTLDVFAPLATVATPKTDVDLAQASEHWTPQQARELVAEVKGATDADAARSSSGVTCVSTMHGACSEKTLMKWPKSSKPQARAMLVTLRPGQAQHGRRLVDPVALQKLRPGSAQRLLEEDFQTGFADSVARARSAA